MKKRKLFLTLLALIAIFISLFAFKQVVLAQDFYGLNDLNLALSNEVEPKSAIVNIINIVLGFLGLIAVIIIIYGGFVWMLSGGEAEKIDKAKKILKNGLIGLVIILLSWGIATFVVGFFAGIGGGGGGSSACTVNEIRNCGCNNAGTQVCQADGTWDACTVDPCTVGPVPDIDCNLNPLLAVCDIDQTECDPYGLICSPLTCKCVAPGSAGTSCNNGAFCTPDDNLCGEYLSCNSTSCLCEGSPVITEISPMGGFCEGEPDKPCVNDGDCGAGFCNTDIPNGAENNLVTIYGANFGNIPGKVLFDGSLEANPPSTVNSECVEYWSDKQIIVAVPAGAETMPITVATPEGKEDSTNDGVGPNIPNFQFNNINRPGLCLIDPISGSFQVGVKYLGVNMFGDPNSDIYFGLYDENQRIRALNANFSGDGKNAGADVPNIATGLTSTFVQSSILGILLNSNYLNFYKNPEPNPSPYISSFEPIEGAPGQYVTIYGQGFGNQRAGKVVKIGNEEVNYTFPAVCANSVWSDNQIIVKVPTSVANGDHIISINYPNGEDISTNNTNPDKFKVDNNLDLLPSLCKISPSKGQIGFTVNLWGEYFGSPQSKAVFNVDRESNEVDVETDGFADKISVEVPTSSISGPVAVKNINIGNSLNYEIGPCETDDECSPEFCCPAGTYKANRCVADLNDCSLEVLNSVYEWSFETGLGDLNLPEDSCLGWSNRIGFCPIDQFCPNSPGKCSASGTSYQELGDCGNASCPAAGCADCFYVDDLNICRPNLDQECDLTQEEEYELGGQTFTANKYCQYYLPESENRWHMSVNTSCPDDWFMTAGNICVSDDDCKTCAGDLVCADIEGGICVSEPLCPPNSSCDLTDSKCKREVAGSCECCCEYGKDERDCCSPLQCKGSCGVGSSGGINYGSCYGCTVKNPDNTINQTASNNACNCTGHTNKYCDTSVPDGVCGDCSEISDENVCRGTNTCCWDFNTSVCQGGARIEAGADEGYCGYYDECDAVNKNICDVNIFEKEGAFKTLAACDLACSDPGAQCFTYTNSGQCIADNSCCWDAKDGANVCRATIGGNDGKIDSGANMGFCAYYNCTGNIPDSCNESDKTIDGVYNTIFSCSFACSNSNIGDVCYKPSDNSCDTTICPGPFSCLNADNSALVPPNNCGKCCCDTNVPESCNLPNTEGLTCTANKAPCDGAARGLCCGCSADTQCGDNAVLGCGVDTCCRTRPNVESFIPEEDVSDKVCRNAVIKVKFNQFMDPSSLYSNIRLLEEMGPNAGPCPSGTYFTENIKAENTNFLAKIWTSLKNLFTRSATAYTAPVPGNIYCLVPGSIQISQATSTIANFYPNELLKASTTYFILAIGDEALDSQTGVLSAWQVGMNGGSDPTFNTVVYSNSEIASFTTLSGDDPNSGVCALDYVRIMPDSYLFNRNDQDPNESDTSINNSTFDTIRDKDKLFTASAYSYDHQEIQGVPGYDWDWDLEISLNDTILSTSTPVGLGSNQLFVAVNDNVRDDIAEIKATINMDAYSESNSFFGGDDASNTSDIYVFICRNPWPSIEADGSWEPFEYDYNSKFYYCRDFGSSAYVDDLPAVIDEPVEPVNLQKVCSLSGKLCDDNSECLPAEDHGGVCISRIIRESYFFRQQGPNAGEITDAVNNASAISGGEVILEWTGVSKYIYDDTAGQFIGKNRIYYGKKGSGSMDYFDLSTSTLFSFCPTKDASNYECFYTIKDLDNNETYVFRMSAISQSNIETMFKNEMEVMPQDVVKPAAPDNCTINYSQGASDLTITCSFLAGNENDIHFLRFYHGLSSGQYGQSFDGQVGSYSVTLPTNIFNNNTTHYFAVSSVDKAGNESLNKSSVINVEIKDAIVAETVEEEE